MNAFAQLERHLLGRQLTPYKTVRNGILTGLVAFGILEWASTLNPNIPRIPVSWLIAVVLPFVQFIVFMRLRSILKRPRNDDFLFALRIRYDQRKALASQAQRNSSNSFLLYSVTIASLSALLEAVVVKERSLVTLIGVPLFLCLVVAGSGLLFSTILKKGLIKPSRKDPIKETDGPIGNSIFRQITAHSVLNIAGAVGAITPKKIRALVKREMMYILRCEPLLLVSALIFVPALLLLLLLLIRDAPSGFYALFSLVSIVAINSINGSILQESAERLTECPYYSPKPKNVIGATVFSSFLFSLPSVIVFVVFTLSRMITVASSFQIVSFFCALLAALFYMGTLILYKGRVCGESPSDWLTLGIISVGLFIPYVGGLFAIIVLSVIVVMELRALQFKNSFAAYRVLLESDQKVDR